jgi:hypothetical protein
MRTFASFASALPRPLAAALLVVALALSSPSGLAQTSSVPASIQAELLAKLEGYDKGFPARAGELANVALLVKTGSARSELSAAEMKLALSRIDRLGGLPHKETVVPYTNAPALAQKVREGRIAVVYVTPGFDAELVKIREALSNVDVLTLGALPTYVPEGIVLGFEIESGKPKILINLEQAKRQSVKFPTDLLRLMKVYR